MRSVLNFGIAYVVLLSSLFYTVTPAPYDPVAIQYCFNIVEPDGDSVFVIYKIDSVQQAVDSSGENPTIGNQWYGIAPESWYDTGCDGGLVNSSGSPSVPVTDIDPYSPLPIEHGDDQEITIDGMGVCDQTEMKLFKSCDGSYYMYSSTGGYAHCVSNLSDEANLGNCAKTVFGGGVSMSINKLWTCTGNVCTG